MDTLNIESKLGLDYLVNKNKLKSLDNNYKIAANTKPENNLNNQDKLLDAIENILQKYKLDNNEENHKENLSLEDTILTEKIIKSNDLIDNIDRLILKQLDSIKDLINLKQKIIIK